MRAAVANASQVSRRKISIAPAPGTSALSARKRAPASATSGGIRYSGRGSSRPSAAKKPRSTSSPQASEAQHPERPLRLQDLRRDVGK